MKDELLTFLQKTKWKSSGDLFIPSHMGRVNVTDVSMGVYITYKQIYRSRYSIKKLKSQLRTLSVEDCLISISRILTVLENEGNFNQQTQKGLAGVFLEKRVANYIAKKLDSEPKFVVFFEQQLLVLFKYAVLYCKSEPANDYNDKKNFGVFSEVLLGITDLLTSKDSEKWGEEELREELLRYSFFYSKENFLQTISRYYELFIEIPEELKRHKLYVSVSNFFKEATGLSIKEFMISGYGLLGLLVQQKSGDFKKDYWLVNIRKHFAKSKLNKKEVELVFGEYTTTVRELQKTFSSQKKNDFNFDFSGLIHHPLVSWDEKRFYPMSLRFLKEKITKQIYWVIFDFLLKGGDKKRRYSYTNFMGVVFEEYVARIFERMFPTSELLGKRHYREIKYKIKKAEQKSVDNIIVYPSTLLLVEVKISQIHIETGITGDTTSFEEDIERIVVESFEQLRKSKDAVLRGQMDLGEGNGINNFQPLIITLNEFPNSPLLWKIVRKKIQETEFFDKELADKLQIIDIEELEILEEFVKHGGISLADILKKKSQDKLYKELPMKNYLYYEYRDYSGLLNQHLDEKYREFTSELRLRLFGAKKEQPKTRE